jgi:hypothetical protein
MSRNSYRPDDYDLQLSNEMQRRTERDDEREPRWMHYSPRPRNRRPRYFSGLMFRRVPAEPATETETTIEETRIAS